MALTSTVERSLAATSEEVSCNRVNTSPSNASTGHRCQIWKPEAQWLHETTLGTCSACLPSHLLLQHLPELTRKSTRSALQYKIILVAYKLRQQIQPLLGQPIPSLIVKGWLQTKGINVPTAGLGKVVATAQKFNAEGVSASAA